VAPTPDDLRAHYAAAIQMAVYDGQLSWQVTGIFVQFAILAVVGAAFPSFAGADSKAFLALIGSLVSVAGLTMTVMFGSMAMRIRTYQDLWAGVSAELENQLELPGLLSKSQLLSTNGSIDVGGEQLKMHWSYGVKTKNIIKWLYILFGVVFIALYGINLYKMVGAG
jgi:hypothetical protein